MQSDPFWKRSGFWAACAATLPFLYAVIEMAASGTRVPMEVTTATLLAWGAFFTGATIRPSVSARRARQEQDTIRILLEQQRQRIRILSEKSGDAP